MRVGWLIGICVVISTTMASAQVRSVPGTSSSPDRDDEEVPVDQLPQRTLRDTNQTGRTASSSVGQVGQRQTRETNANETGIKPMARVENRIPNRVQNRIQNRIDRNYNPQAGTTDPFAVAEDQTRAAGRPR